MKRLATLAALTGLAGALVATQSRIGPKGPAHKFVKVAEDVYAAMATGTVNVGSNTAVIVNERDVLIVDSHITPAAARALVEDLKTLTPKPVRYVVNSHYHFDHAHGNQVFPPEAEILGHEFARQMLLTNVLEQRTYLSFTTPVPGQIADLKKQIAAEPDAARKAQLESRLSVQEDYLAALKEIEPTPPTLTLQNKLTLFRGSREIQLLFLGRGHTGGDVVVYLPKERVVCTGDLQTAALSYAGDAHVDEWVATLDALKALDFDTVIPGHGDPFNGKERITNWQNYLKDLWAQTRALKRQGVGPEDAAKRVDLTAHKANFPMIQGPGADPRAVTRIYEITK